jgi:hypothetical protein
MEGLFTTQMSTVGTVVEFRKNSGAEVVVNRDKDPRGISGVDGIVE